MTIGEHFPTSGINLHLPSARRRRAVPDWAPPKSISELLAEKRRAYRIADIDPNPRTRAEVQNAETALADGQWRAATEFGAPHLWRPAKRSFAFNALAGFTNSKRRFRHLHPPLEFMDHSWCFRWAHGHGPAAIVAQPYKPAFNLDKAVEFARENKDSKRRSPTSRVGTSRASALSSSGPVACLGAAVSAAIAG